MEISASWCLLKIVLLANVISISSGSQPVGINVDEPDSSFGRDIYSIYAPADEAEDAGLGQHVGIVKRSTANIVDIARFDDSSPPGKQFSVYVDETMTRLMIKIEVDRSNPVVIITKPSGTPGPHPSLNTTTGSTVHSATIDVAVTAADYGIWKLLKMDANTWSVTVQGESPLDFTYQFLEGAIFKMPITGDPIQGKTYQTVLTVAEYSKVQKIDMLMLFITAKSTPADMRPLKDLGSGKYDASIPMLDQEFMLGIQGKDKSGHFFRRLSSPIKPVTLSLYVPPYTGVKLYENTKLDVEFSVVNEMTKDQDIDVRIVDTKKFAEAPIFISATLKPGENFTGKFVIKAGLPGETTVATITARQYLGGGKFSLGPSEVRQFTVERNDTTTTSTTTTTTTTTPSTTTSTTISSTTNTKSTISSSGSVSTTARSVSSTVGSASTNAKKASTSMSVSAGVSSVSSSVSATTIKSLASSSSVSATGSVVASRTTLKASMSGSVKSVVSSAGTKSSLPSASASTAGAKVAVSAGSTSAKPTVVPLTGTIKTGAKVVTTSANAKIVGKTTTIPAEDPADEESSSFNKGEVFAAAIASGMATGVLIGVAALLVMVLIFKKVITGKNAVAPKKKKNQRTLSEHNELAWT